MSDKPWPDEPSRRKIVLVLNQDDIEALRFEDGGADLLNNKEVHILSSHPSQPGLAVQALIDQGLVTPDTVLVQNPFEKSLYHHEPEAVEQIVLAKWQHFSTLCSLLGASEVKIEDRKKKITGSSSNLSNQVDIVTVGDVEVEIKKENLDSFISGLTLIDTFEGGEPNVQAANEFLQQTGLSADTSMRGLLDIFQRQTNKIKSRKLELNLTTEAHRNLKVLANFNVPEFLTSLEIDYERKVHEQTEYTLTIAVEF